ncbi:MAG: glycosyltransferase family 8 protein [Syntrophales bacterium]
MKTSALAGKNVIHVVFAVDANYVMPLTVAICSTAIKCDKNRGLMFHVLQSGIGQELRAKVERSLERTEFPEAQVNWIDTPLERIADFHLAHPWITSMAYARLLIPELLPIEVEKALYLDCYIAVNEDIGKLWDTDLGEKSLFAVRDEIATVSHPRKGLKNYRELGIPADAHYFNSGVLLMNLDKWRERDTAEQLLNYLRTHRAIIHMGDQEVLNAVLWDDWGELDYRWNWQIPWRGYRLGRAKMSWVPETTKQSIVHFATGEKPWLPGCDYEERKYFFEYLDQTEWAGWRVPVLKELFGRLSRTLQDTRDALGRLRRELVAG